MSDFTKYTHRGWYVCCPVYLGFNDDTLWMEERHWILAPLMVIADAMNSCISMVLSVVNPDFEPGFLVTHVVELDSDLDM